MKLVFLFSTLLIFHCVLAQKKQRVLFYNVENLFDTIKGLNDDSEYLPSSKKEWNSAKYLEKLTHIRQVLNDAGRPIVAGFCEVENEGVVRDIIKNQKNFENYGLVHYESEDKRGIDVAMIYDSSKLKLAAKGILRFRFDDDTAARTRDILWANYKFKKHNFYVIVNHWPSRTGGVEKTEARRLKAAQTAFYFVDSLLAIDSTTRIIFMGDLNDHPNDIAPQLMSLKLQPMISSSSGKMGGTHYYDKKWDVLDHIMVSSGALKAKKLKVTANSGIIHEFPYLLKDVKGTKYPFRTYHSGKYQAGYSDHLPVSVEISIP
jgi:predicted extracellular nuclease